MTEQMNFSKSKNQQVACPSHSLQLLNSRLSSFQISCPICFTIYQKPRILPCGHVFCSSCILDWAQNYKKSCPLCRKQIRKTRGFYGRCENKISKVVQKLKVKCRNCCWQGTNWEFRQNFKVGAFIQDLVFQQIKAQKDTQIQQNTINMISFVIQGQKLQKNENQAPQIMMEGLQQLLQRSIQRNPEEEQQIGLNQQL